MTDRIPNQIARQMAMGAPRRRGRVLKIISMSKQDEILSLMEAGQRPEPAARNAGVSIADLNHTRANDEEFDKDCAYHESNMDLYRLGMGEQNVDNAINDGDLSMTKWALERQKGNKYGKSVEVKAEVKKFKGPNAETVNRIKLAREQLDA